MNIILFLTGLMISSMCKEVEAGKELNQRGKGDIENKVKESGVEVDTAKKEEGNEKKERFWDKWFAKKPAGDKKEDKKPADNKKEEKKPKDDKKDEKKPAEDKKEEKAPGKEDKSDEE
eukprot:GHVP01059189.1.p1 GENE.GHVP01059189.1~~GHVP01059189.1.p1  ORF type:complete len:118 (-),score=46.32 GHVP01059189.1:162-515(-)